MATLQKLPKGWRYEVTCFGAACQFITPHGSVYLWVDGSWKVSIGGSFTSAPGIPRASNVRQARAVGTAWIIKVQAEIDAEETS